MDYDSIVQDVIEEHKVSPIDMLGIGDTTGEYNYLKTLKDSYIRTVRDIDNLYKNDRASRKILEIGSFLGPVSISLKRIGYSVCALDIPEFYNSSSLRALYKNNGITFDGLNLRGSKLPYESNTFDAVIICEVLEHLNFNPLPVLEEINRVLKASGHIYIGMPNQSNIINRIKLFLGRSVHNPIEDYFKQLDKKANMIVGLHWREYTLNETLEMIGKMGFETVTKYYYMDNVHKKTSLLKNVLKAVAYSYPPFRPYQVVIGKKVDVPNYDFWITEANS